MKSLGIRSRGVRVVSCPSCARQGFDVIRTVEALEGRLQHIKTPMSLSVLGCVVNGPGEARETDIGITGGGNGKHMVYLSGVTDHHVQDADMIDHIVRLVEAKAAEIEAAELPTLNAARVGLSFLNLVSAAWRRDQVAAHPSCKHGARRERCAEGRAAAADRLAAVTTFSRRRSLIAAKPGA